MKEYPILFQPDMVRAKLEGRKTQTRRLTGLQEINEFPHLWEYEGSFVDKGGELYSTFRHHITCDRKDLKCPYGAEGSVLWVRETWRKYRLMDDCGYYGDDVIDFAADNPEPMVDRDGDGFHRYDKKGHEKMIPFRPSIHLKKKDVRIYLQNTCVRIQRLQDISEEDAIAEGVMPNCTNSEKCPSPICQKNGCQAAGEYVHYLRDVEDFPAASAKESFQSLIQKIHGPEIWDQNPWVWVVSFKVLSTTGRPDNLEELCAAS